MPRRPKITEGDLPAEFLERYAVVVREMEGWADRVVEAWLARQDGRFQWHADDFLYWFDVEVEGRSIISGECLVTRAQDGFIALVNGKQFRSLSLKTEVQLLESSLARHNVPGFVVPPPHSWPWIDAEELDRWYRVLRQWKAMSSAEAAAEFTALAVRLVDTFLAGEQWSYFDGYHWAGASRNEIFAWTECLAVRAPDAEEAVLVSARNFRRGIFKPMVRESIKLVFADRGIRVHDVRPKTSSYVSPADLEFAWNLARPKLI